MIIVTVKIYKKAGKPGWASIVPFYNIYVLSEFTWGKGWYGLAYYGVIIVLNAIDSSTLTSLSSIASLAVIILTYVRLAKSFGKSGGFACGLIFLNPIFLGILAFSKNAKYIGVNGVSNEFSSNVGVNYRENNNPNVNMNGSSIGANYTYNANNTSNGIGNNNYNTHLLKI